MIEFNEMLENNLECRVDWLSFTVLEYESLSSVLELYGFVLDDFTECQKGAMGYKKMLVLNGSTLRVLYDGNENMGIHFDVSGSAMSDLYSYYRAFYYGVETPWGTTAVDWDIQIASELFAQIVKYGHCTRLDLAIDNKERVYFRMNEIVEILKSGRFVSKFRTWNDMSSSETNGIEIGHTLYLGSRKSDIMLRVYDKRLERKMEDFTEWIRWELELKNERAQMALQYLIERKGVGSVCVGILENYFRIIVFDDSNKSRCSSDIKWQSFVGDIEKLTLYVQHDEKTLEQKEEWVIRQVAPTIAGLIIANHGDASFLMNYIPEHANRMKRGLREMVDRANPDWQKSLSTFK